MSPNFSKMKSYLKHVLRLLRLSLREPHGSPVLLALVQTLFLRFRVDEDGNSKEIPILTWWDLDLVKRDPGTARSRICLDLVKISTE